MHRFLLASLLVCFGVTMATAQTKTSGTEQCSKPDPQHVLPIGDRTDHQMSLQQLKCTWSKPMEVDGIKAKEGLGTETNDISGSSARTRGFHVTTMESGDKIFASYQGRASSKQGAPTDAKGTWGFTGGTGKLKGIKGKGTYNCTPSGDGFSCEIEGEYQLAK
jgi:hypothetical protein